MQDDTQAQQPAVERAIAAVMKEAPHSQQQREGSSGSERWAPDWRKMAAASVRVLAWTAQVCHAVCACAHLAGDDFEEALIWRNAQLEGKGLALGLLRQLTRHTHCLSHAC